MRLRSVRIRNYRNIIDSGDVSIDQAMTCLVGKNEAGKSAVLEAIHTLNPLKNPSGLRVSRDYPQWLWKKHERAWKSGKAQGGFGASPMIEGVYEIGEEARRDVESVFGPQTLKSPELRLQRWYPIDDQPERVFALSVDEAAFVAWFANEQGFARAVADGERLPGLRKAAAEDESEVGTATATALAELLGEGTLSEAVYSHLKRHHLPKTLYFSEYAELDGEYLLTDVIAEVETPDEDADESLRTAADFMRLAEIDPSGAEADDYVETTAELRAVSNELTREMREFWSQSSDVALKVDINKKERRVDPNRQVIDRYLRFEIDDTSHGYQTNLDRRSTGFRWFISFMAAFFEHRHDDNVILLLDEPGLSLHARAQADLLDAIEERVADSRQTLYSTHSPFMVRPAALDEVRIVEDHGPDEGGAKVSDNIVATDADTLFPLQAALGYDTAMNLFIGPYNVIVEGTSDYIYLNYFRNRLAGGHGPIRSSATLLATRGVTKIPAFLALLGRPQLDLVVVVDGDNPSQALRRSIDRGLVREEAVICVGQYALGDRTNGDVEDLFDTSNYLKLFNHCYGTDYKPADLPPGDRIVKRLEALHGEFNHGEVAEHFMRHSGELAPNDQTADRFCSLLEAIDAAFNGDT